MQYLQQHMQPFARWALMPLIRLHLAPLHEEQEVLSFLRNSSPLSHLLHAFLALGVATGCTLSFLGFVVLFFGGCWVLWSFRVVCNLSCNSFLTRLR